MNKYEIRIFALRRSGHHAIINWILSTFDQQKICFINDCSRTHNIKKLSKRKNKDNDCYLYNLEHYDLSLLDYSLLKEYESQRKHFTNIVILRDIFNWAASIYNFPREAKERIPLTIDLWKTYAKIFIGETNPFKEQTIFIKYNNWFLNKEYREQIAKQLNIKPKETSLKQLGSKSSFDSHLKDYSQMKTIDRWKVFQSDQEFMNLFDEESKALSKQIFGWTINETS